jgi:hypothetical protein
MDNDLIFVVIRHVSKSMENCNEVWKECIKSIRTYYKNKIIIIDNNSDLDVLTNDFIVENCDIINNPHYETRLFSPYYFLLNYDFNKAVILHDGCIFQKYVNFFDFEKVKYIWHFNTKIYDDIYLIEQQLNYLTNNSVLYNTFRNKQFIGCMGCCLAIDKSFLMEMETKFKISNLNNVINNQEKAIAFERTISILCFTLYPNLINNLSYEGEIKDMVWGYIYKHFINKQTIFEITDCQNNTKYNIDITDKSIIKIFGARK